MRIYEVIVTGPAGERTLKVPSKTDVQATDAAVALMQESESVLSVRETDDPYQQVDGPPAGTQTYPDRIV